MEVRFVIREPFYPLFVNLITIGRRPDFLPLILTYSRSVRQCVTVRQGVVVATNGGQIRSQRVILPLVC